jgi:hypothetical protein
LLPQLASRLGGLPPARSSDPETSRSLLFASVAQLIVEVTKARPVLLVIDDLQWADRASLELLGHLAGSAEAQRVLVLATFREADIISGHPVSELIASLHRTGNQRRIRLKGLGDEEIVSLMRARAGHELDENGMNLAVALREETDGNPFFIVEILRHLSETGSIYRDQQGRWRASGDLSQVGLPQSVHEVVGSRASRLGPACERLLELAAVVGRQFQVDLLAAAAELDVDTVLDLIERACAADLIGEVPDSVGLFRFRHALIQHSLYDFLTATRRARLHQRVGEALESFPGGAARLAELSRHWMLASRPTQLDKALLYAQQAGDAALLALAPTEARRFFSHALELLEHVDEPSPDAVIDVLLGLGTAQRQSGDSAFRATLLRAAQKAIEAGAIDRLVRAVLAADRGFYTAIGRVDAERVAVVEAALGSLVQADSADRARLMAILATELMWGSPLQRRLTLVDSAVAMARRVADPATVIHVANLGCFSIQIPHTLERRLEYSGEALSLARRLNDPVLLHWAAAARSIAAVHACLADEIDEDFQILERSAVELNEPGLLWHAKLRLASRPLLAGDPDRAEILAAEARDIGLAAGHPDAALIFSPQLAVCRWQQGRTKEFIPQAAEQAARVPGMPAFVAVLALAYSDCGEIHEARRLLDDMTVKGFSTLPLDSVWMNGLILWAQVAADCGDKHAARQLFDLMAPFRGLACYDRITFLGFIDHYLGQMAAVLGDYPLAEAMYSTAGALAEKMEARWAAAATDLALGELRLTRNESADIQQGATCLRRSLNAARIHGYATIERRSQAALNRIGG